MKRSLIYCISIILVIVLLSVSAFAATITDSGMEASPYLITNEAELQQLETNVKYGKSYSGKYFRGSNDITLTQAWTPIGTASTPFCGIFDGNGKTISKMTVSGDHSALFAIFPIAFCRRIISANVYHIVFYVNIMAMDGIPDV